MSQVGEDSERELPVSPDKLVEHPRENGTGGYSSQIRNERMLLKEPSHSRGFQRGFIQDSRGRGLIKVLPDEKAFRLRDRSRDRAQKPNNARNSPHHQKKESDKPMRKNDYSRQREDRSPSKSGTPPSSSGLRQFWDQHVYNSQGKGSSSQSKTNSQGRGTTEKITYASDCVQHKNKNSGYDTDTSQESREKSSGKSRSKAKGWKPSREILNVDSIFESERRQGSPKHKTNSADKQLHSKELISKDVLSEHRKHRGLMTIYEDEFRLESGSRSSSMEFDGKTNVEKEKASVNANLKCHGEAWQVQRTESGYESSDRLSNGSTGLDSPGVEVSNAKDVRFVPESFSERDQQAPHKVDAHSIQMQGYKVSRDDGAWQVKSGLENSKSWDQSVQRPNFQRSQIGAEKFDKSQPLEKIGKGALSPQPKRVVYDSAGMRVQNRQYKDDESSPQHQLKQTYTDPAILSSSADTSIRDRFVPPEPHKTSIGDVEKLSLGPYQQTSSVQAKSSSAVPLFPPHYQDMEIDALESQQGSSAHLNPGYHSPENPQIRQHPPSGGAQSHHVYENRENFQEPVHEVRSSPPPLPPKMYARRGQTNLKNNLLNTRPLPEPREEMANAKKILGQRRDDNFDPVFSHDRQTKAASDNYLKLETDAASSRLFSACTPGLPNDVAPTTYFSVDSCMTDTYRVKYHERPKLYFADMKANEFPPGGHSFQDANHGSGLSAPVMYQQPEKLRSARNY
uniref:Uncharacterized protein n=1 Tax=Callorhinchus milii TaxID=7868 RepID=A0A4W3GQQ3_CALMI